MKDFTFDLQLFADEGNTDTVVQPEMDTTEEQPVDTNFDFAIDEDGDIVFNTASSIISDSNYETEKPAPEEEVEATEQGQAEEPVTEVPQAYKVKVGGEEYEVSLDELLNGYMRQQDYTRKTQELAEQRRQAPQQQPQYEQPKEQVQPTNNEAFTQKAYYEQLAELGKQNVKNVLGEDYDEFNPIHATVMADTIATIKAQMYEQMAVENKMQQVYNKYAQDPNFKEMDIHAQYMLESLPYKEGVRIQQALANGDSETIDQFMTAVRNDYYGRKNAQPTITPIPKTRVPYVEKGGPAIKPPTPTTQAFDMKQLGRMSIDEQADLFTKLGLTKL